MTHDYDLSGPDGVADGTVDYPVVCERCGEEDICINVEAFEETGETVCDDCAEEVLFENGPFGVGA